MVKALPSLFLVLFGLPFFACGLWLLGSLAGAFLRLREFDRQVPATILAHEQIVLGTRRPIHRPTVRYSYEVNGGRRESTCHDLLQTFPLVSRGLGKKGKLPYEVGQTLTAHVDAEGEAILSFELQYAALLGPAGALFILLGGAFMVGPPLAAWRRSGERRDRARGLLAPRWETSQGGLAVLSAVAVGLTLMTGLVITEARAWSVPAAILLVGFAAGTFALARLYLREQSRRRPFAGCRVRRSDGEWTLSGGRLAAPTLELAFRAETRTVGEDGPGPWTGDDEVRLPLEAVACPEGWRGKLSLDAARQPIDEPLRRHFWLLRVRDGSRSADFPL